jgi:hypothetical protein
MSLGYAQGLQFINGSFRPELRYRVEGHPVVGRIVAGLHNDDARCHVARSPERGDQTGQDPDVAIARPEGAQFTECFV